MNTIVLFLCVLRVRLFVYVCVMCVCKLFLMMKTNYAKCINHKLINVLITDERRRG